MAILKVNLAERSYPIHIDKDSCGETLYSLFCEVVWKIGAGNGNCSGGTVENM